jgi:hypothetical protein
MALLAYNKIKRLTSQMNAPGIAKRREASKELREYLNESTTRERLLQEAYGGKEPLQAVWSMIMSAAIVSFDKAAKRKIVLKEEDIATPYYMLLRLDEFAKFAKIDSLLSMQMVRELLEFTVNSLSDKEVCKAAEDVLLNMMELLCSKREFVAYYRPKEEMHSILAELQERLEDPTHEYFEIAAKTLCALLTTAKKLGVAMHLILPRCLNLIDTWCRDRLLALQQHKLRSANEVFGYEYMFSAAVAALSTHPDHLIYEFSSRGQCMLKLAKKCYPHAVSKKEKEALIEYFLAHL